MQLQRWRERERNDISDSDRNDDDINNKDDVNHGQRCVNNSNEKVEYNVDVNISNNVFDGGMNTIKSASVIRKWTVAMMMIKTGSTMKTTVTTT